MHTIISLVEVNHSDVSRYTRDANKLNKKETMSSIKRSSLVDNRTSVNSVGTPINSISAEKQLNRLVLACMLWEDQFYVQGKTNVESMKELVAKVSPEKVSELALKARSQYKLRHVPLLLTRELARIGKLEASVLTNVIQRADEMGEFLALYWKDGKTALSNQVKKGLAGAFVKFNEYALAKNDKNSASVSIRDVMFLVHPKPMNMGQEELFKCVANQELKTPDTWETQLSSGADKAETFVRLMGEKKLGALAFLRNLRNMVNAGVPESDIRAYGLTVDVSKVLPFRYIAAAKIMPQFEDMLEAMMFRSLAGMEKLPGRTVLVVDTSGSMGQVVSSKSDLRAIDAAGALAILAREICEEVVIYATAGDDGRRKHATMVIPPRRGFALAEYITSSEVRRTIGGGGIFFTQVMDFIATKEKANSVDRVIVFTDEQDTSEHGRSFNPANAKRLAPAGKNYIANVGSNKNGVNSAQWETITGFSEAFIDYIRESEKE